MASLERIKFTDHIKNMSRDWQQGEHVFIGAPTGAGKTTLISSLVEDRGYVIMFSVKRHDPTLAKEFAGWSIVDSFDEIEPWMNRVLVWPNLERKRKKLGKRGRVSTAAFLAHQRNVLQDSFDKLAASKGWYIVADELNYLANPTFGGLAKMIALIHILGRSAGLTMITAAQRPSHVPLEVLANCSHAYIANNKVAGDKKRLSELGNIDPHVMVKQLESLPDRHDFLYTPTLGKGAPGVVNTRK